MVLFNSFKHVLRALLALIVFFSIVHASSWDKWWAYDGISGPDYWGILNPKWSHCSKGRKQSPIDMNPDLLLFDPGLEPVQMKGDSIQGKLMSTGRRLLFNVSDPASLIITSGPLSYQYSINHLVFHYGRESDRGSEHTINGIPFAGEIQFYFYNSQLYHNWTQASQESNGLAVIAVLIQSISGGGNKAQSNGGLKSILKAAEHIKFRGSHFAMDQINVAKLLPTLEHYITYEGSLTEPPCHETVQWILLNKPIYATEHDLSSLRGSINIDGYGDNFRPVQATNYRCIRTNILRNFNLTANQIPKSGEGRQDANKRLCGNKGYVTYKANVKRLAEAEIV